MALVKDSDVLDRRYLPARDLAARATSKHGNPADYALVCSTDVAGTAEVVATRVHSEAYGLDDRSHRAELKIFGIRGAQEQLAVIVDVAPDGDSTRNHGGFSLKFAPRTENDRCPRFEGQVRVEHVDPASSRVVAQGRYIGGTAATLVDEAQDRTTAEDALRQIVALLVAAVHAQ